MPIRATLIMDYIEMYRASFCYVDQFAVEQYLTLELLQLLGNVFISTSQVGFLSSHGAEMPLFLVSLIIFVPHSR